MKILDLGRYAVSISVAAAMLAGCGGSQSPIGAPAINETADAGAAHRFPATSSYQVLHRFSVRGHAANSNPDASLLDMNGTLYGTIVVGGSFNNGAVYSVAQSSSESVIYSRKPAVAQNALLPTL